MLTTDRIIGGVLSEGIKVVNYEHGSMSTLSLRMLNEFIYTLCIPIWSANLSMFKRA